MKVIEVDDSNENVTVLEVRLEQTGHTNEVFVNREIKSYLRKRQQENKLKGVVSNVCNIRPSL